MNATWRRSGGCLSVAEMGSRSVFLSGQAAKKNYEHPYAPSRFPLHHGTSYDQNIEGNPKNLKIPFFIQQKLLGVPYINGTSKCANSIYCLEIVSYCCGSGKIEDVSGVGNAGIRRELGQRVW